jgi:peroxiredoxin
MNSMIRIGAAIAVAAAILSPLTRALAVDPGGIAPPFELPFLDGAGSLRSSELYAKYDETFLVFWQSSCPHCVEGLLGCERFFREYGGANITVIGVNTDERDRLSAQRAIESSRITFPQTRDPGGTVSTNYDVPRETFTVYLVGRGGRVIQARFDPQGDIGSVMEEMLLSPRSRYASSGALAADEGAGGAPAGVSYRGFQRVRFLAIDTRGPEAAGLYGEAVRPLNSVQYRLEIEASKRITAHLRAGGLLRISSEGRKVLESGPEYLGSEWGSAFAEIEAARFSARLGYYSISMTPLTLMRWDWDDNPRVGGDAGCGCGGAVAGALLVESLEELGPELTFEGALAAFNGRDIEARLFYAIPRRALQTSYSAYRSDAGERAKYSLELCGFEARWQRMDERTGSFWKAGVHAITSFENRRSVDFGALGYLSSDPWVDTWTVSVTAEIPIVRYARLRGELLCLNKTEEHGVLTMDGIVDFSREGGGGVGGIVVEKSERLGLMIDYLRLDPDFFTPLAALSYDPNVEGFRASARAPLFTDIASLSLFYKRLHEADVVTAGAQRQQVSLSGASLDFDVGAGFGAGLGWLERKSWRDGAVSPFDEYRRGIVANLSHDFGRAAVIRLQYERMKSVDSTPDLATESDADMYSLYSSIYF